MIIRMQDPKTPHQSVIDAFKIIAPLQPLSGGRGLCFLAGDVVLRPVDEPAETQWLSGVLLNLSQLPHANREYRIAKPLQSTSIASASGEIQFIVDGWSASSFVQGEEGPGGKWAHILTTSRAFHRDLGDLVSEPPAFLALKTDRWAEADRVTWGEKRFEDVPDVNHDILGLISPHLEKLEQIKKPLPIDSLKRQIVHADLTGNVLFDEGGSGLAPAIIDISPIWRPVEFAEAVVVVDGLLNHGQGIELIELYGTDELRLQVLVRALNWRILVFAIQSDLAWIKVYMPKTDFEGAVKLVMELVDRGKPA
jgi:uncharacterized protein (TIGR02569 family)